MMTGATKYIPALSMIKLISYSSTDYSESMLQFFDVTTLNFNHKPVFCVIPSVKLTSHAFMYDIYLNNKHIIYRK